MHACSTTGKIVCQRFRCKPSPRSLPVDVVNEMTSDNEENKDAEANHHRGHENEQDKREWMRPQQGGNFEEQTEDDQSAGNLQKPLHTSLNELALRGAPEFIMA